MKCIIPQTAYPERIRHGTAEYVRIDLVEQTLNEEYAKRVDLVYKEVGRDVVAQIMATCCTVLNKDYHFGKDRLLRFKQGVEGLFKIMLKDGIVGQEFTTENCINYMRDNYGIDFDKKEEVITKNE